jgi:hypothetical protein
MALDLEKLVKAAVHCSVFVSPTSPGLTPMEVVEVGKRLGFKEGEINDAIGRARNNEHVLQYIGRPYLQPAPNTEWCDFFFRDDPDFRNVAAFDFVRNELQELAKQHGAKHAQIERAVLVERGVHQGIPRDDIEATITVMVLGEHCVEKDSIVRLHPNRSAYPLASQQVDQSQDMPVRANELKRRAYPIVVDLIARRTDGRPAAVEPLDAFGEMLVRLGYRQFRLWWTQTVAELRQLDATLNPVASAVLSAAIVEAALTFVVAHGRKLGVGPFKSRDFDSQPRTWKIDDLVKSAASGGEASVLDEGTRHRADELIRTRQRIHAGRMLSDYPGGPPDLRPEEARDAKRTADLMVRRVLDWLARYPPT